MFRITMKYVAFTSLLALLVGGASSAQLATNDHRGPTDDVTAVVTVDPFVVFIGDKIAAPLFVLHVGAVPPDGGLAAPVFVDLDAIEDAGLVLFLQTRTRLYRVDGDVLPDNGTVISCPKGPFSVPFKDGQIVAAEGMIDDSRRAHVYTTSRGDVQVVPTDVNSGMKGPFSVPFKNGQIAVADGVVFTHARRAPWMNTRGDVQVVPPVVKSGLKGAISVPFQDGQIVPAPEVLITISRRAHWYTISRGDTQVLPADENSGMKGPFSVPFQDGQIVQAPEDVITVSRRAHWVTPRGDVKIVPPIVIVCPRGPFFVPFNKGQIVPSPELILSIDDGNDPGTRGDTQLGSKVGPGMKT
jgi:hypothetical protein